MKSTEARIEPTSVGYSDAKDDDDGEYLEVKAAMSDLSEATVVSISCSGRVKSLARNLTEDLDDELVLNQAPRTVMMGLTV
ncbi:Hypothetical protein PHPALM_13676 [Phytophthora palmivora]|uniref:Uncharacterized protein n=1 Tax=Phytophthora palmivora TaxID=4796 RepID=A0A2P4XWZ1_9STRA|nr:Hypothetical protein PHPALM_13676 [Phytophthora palmivora]